MGDRGTLAKAKKELEDLYLGVPDESVNLTFQDFAQVRIHQNQNQNQNQNNAETKKLSPSSTMSPIAEKSKSPISSPLAKLPSLDFSKGFPSPHHHHHHHHNHLDIDQRSIMYDDMSVANYGVERGGRRRPGIPHSNICALCCNYIYICRHRCLVCGRVYCRQCVNTGMGDMTEGRKCTDCLGRRFSQRYIHRAGNIGWCMVYPSVVKQQELKWAERGARRSGDNMRYGNRRSPVASGTPSRHHANPPSFVMNSPINHQPMPF